MRFRVVSERRSLRRRILAAVLVSAAAMLAAAGPAYAVFDAQFKAFCCYMTLEAGDSAVNWIEFTNTGDQPWFPTGNTPAHLSTEVPQDRSSAFFKPGSWLGANRPTAVDQAQVDPGQVGRFTFTILAPSAPGLYTEYFSPVIESVAHLVPGCCFFNWTVIAAQPPAVAITSAPARVKQGDPIAVVATATDNLAVSAVTASIAGAGPGVAAVAGAASSYGALLDSSALAPGTHTITVHAVDPGGRDSVATADFEVYVAPAPTPTPAPAKPSTPTVRTFLLSSAVIRGGRVQDISLHGLRAGESVSVFCANGCGKRATTHALRRIKVRHSGPRSIRLPARPRVTGGSLLTVDVTAPHILGRFSTYRIASRSYRLKSRGCLDAAVHKAACG